MIAGEGFFIQMAFVGMNRAAATITAEGNIFSREGIIKRRIAQKLGVVGSAGGFEPVVGPSVKFLWAIGIVRVTQGQEMLGQCLRPKVEDAFESLAACFQIGIAESGVPFAPCAKASEIN